jgi:hypothetical protein
MIKYYDLEMKTRVKMRYRAHITVLNEAPRHENV